VWLAFSIRDKKLYALKILRSHPKYLDTGYEEENLNRLIADNHDHPAWVKTVKQRTKGSGVTIGA